MKIDSAQSHKPRKDALRRCEVVQDITTWEAVGDGSQGAKKGTESGQTLFGIYASMVGPEGFEPPTKRL